MAEAMPQIDPHNSVMKLTKLCFPQFLCVFTNGPSLVPRQETHSSKKEWQSEGLSVCWEFVTAYSVFDIVTRSCDITEHFGKGLPVGGKDSGVLSEDENDFSTSLMTLENQKRKMTSDQKRRELERNYELRG